MNKFEVVLLFSPDLSNSIISNEAEKFTKNIEDIDGKIISLEDWGLRDLSYNIKNYKKAFYKFNQIELDNQKIVSTKTSLNQNENILRHLFVKVKEHQTLPTKMNNEEK